MKARSTTPMGNYSTSVVHYCRRKFDRVTTPTTHAATPSTKGGGMPSPCDVARIMEGM